MPAPEPGHTRFYLAPAHVLAASDALTLPHRRAEVPAPLLCVDLQRHAMPHSIEPASSGRAKCRGCGQPIIKGELRFGERLPNAFGDGEMTLWFHLNCAAFKRPAPLLDALAVDIADPIPRRETLEATAQFGIANRRVPRIDGAERAPTGRARCRSCRELIARSAWRIRLVYFEEARFEPSGFVHAECASEYFGTGELIDRIAHFSPNLGPEDLAELSRALATGNDT